MTGKSNPLYQAECPRKVTVNYISSMKMEMTECSKTLAHKIQTSRNNPK
jgi:hypothetical protein